LLALPRFNPDSPLPFAARCATAHPCPIYYELMSGPTTALV